MSKSGSLVNLQRLLDEGLFVATYKYALLLSIADLCIEQGDDSGAPLLLATEDIAEKIRAILLAARRTIRYSRGRREGGNRASGG